MLRLQHFLIIYDIGMELSQIINNTKKRTLSPIFPSPIFTLFTSVIKTYHIQDNKKKYYYYGIFTLIYLTNSKIHLLSVQIMERLDSFITQFTLSSVSTPQYSHSLWQTFAASQTFLLHS